MKHLLAAIAATTLTLTTAPAADATRPVPTKAGAIDRCDNIPGRQAAYQLVGTGPYRPIRATANAWDCYRLDRSKDPMTRV